MAKKKQGLNLMIGPAQFCEQWLAMWLDIEEKYNITVTDKETEEYLEYFDMFEITWKKEYIQKYYDSIKDAGDKYEAWRKWCVQKLKTMD